MFGKSRQKKLKVSRVSTVVGQGSEIRGDIVFTGGLHVDGTIKGDVRADSDSDAILSLSELGVIEGEVRVPMIVLNGSVVGNVYASEKIELASQSKVIGDVTYNLIEMAVGAEVNGQLLHQEQSPPSKTAAKEVSIAKHDKELPVKIEAVANKIMAES